MAWQAEITFAEEPQEIFRWRAALSEETLNACEFYER